MQTLRALFLLPAVLGLCLGGCATTRTFQRPYPQVESALLQRLDTAGKDLHAKPQTVEIVSRELARCLSGNGSVQQGGSIQVAHYTAGQRIRLRAWERYDIGGIGGNFLTIDLRRADDRRTRVAVNYVDRAIGFFVIPFAYVNPGWVRESKMVRCLMRLEGDLQEADKLPRLPPLPPRGPEQSCERIQSRSCGPPGAVIPCDTAGGDHLQCICKGVLVCR